MNTLGCKMQKDSKGWLLGWKGGRGWGWGVNVAMVTGAKNEKKQNYFETILRVLPSLRNY